MDGRYRIVRSLGSGGMAEVFLAIAAGAEGFEKPVVVKRLHSHLARQEQVARMFLAEARLAMHLHHQNIVQVIDVGRGPEGLYLVMELVDGWDLGIVLGKAKQARYLTEPLAAYVASQVAAGMAHAMRRTHQGKPLLHAHRDLSPSNILLTGEGEVKVADFGIARLEEGGGTEPGSFKGKVPFSAPEMIRGLPATQASDQFSLGVVMFRLLGRGHPFEYTDNIVQYAELLARAGPAKVDFASPGLRRILSRLLALRPEDRYPSWDEVALELGSFIAQSGTPANATELARYLGSLGLPPPPSALLQAPAAAAAPTSPPPAGGELQLETEWQPTGGLDASGALIKPAPRPAAPPVRVAPPPPPSPAPVQLRGTPGLDFGSEPENPAFMGHGDRPLELAGPNPAERGAEPVGPPPGESYDPLPQRYQSPARGRTFRNAMIIFVTLIVGAAFFVVAYSGRLRHLVSSSGIGVPGLEPATPVLSIDSTPDGATVFADGTELGTTPLLRENDFTDGATVQLKLTLKGYRPWTGTFVGGKEAKIAAQLKRR